MHFEILVEDQSGKKMLGTILLKLVGNHTFKVHPYKGIGHIPKNLHKTSDPQKRLLLNRLPKLFQGYGKAFHKQKEYYKASVIVVVDLDDKCFHDFRLELFNILHNCNPKPDTLFCFAIEEGEAWLLGDQNAIKKAYPNAKDDILQTYNYDSICGTWEILADAIYPGGSTKLSALSWQENGKIKSEWAETITPYLDSNNNHSPSFNYFVNKIRDVLLS